MGGGASKQKLDGTKRLVLYSEHAAAVPSFAAALHDNAEVVGAQYAFETATHKTLLAQLKTLVKMHGRFASVALAPLGPDRPPKPPEDTDDCCWEVSATLVQTSASQLLKADEPMRKLLEGLGQATVDEG